MNGYTYGVVFAKGVTISEVNPDNYHMKNNYADNIFATCLSVLPIVDTFVKNIRVVKGFIALKKYKSDNGEDNQRSNEKKYCKGLGLEITWDDYNKKSCRIIASKILMDLPGENFIIIIKDNSVEFLRKTLTTKIIEKVDKEFREIYKRE